MKATSRVLAVAITAVLGAAGVGAADCGTCAKPKAEKNTDQAACAMADGSTCVATAGKAACTKADGSACAAPAAKACKAGCTKACCDKGGQATPATPAAAAGHGATVDTASLAASMKGATPPLVFDARSGKWDDGRRVPGAKALSAQSSDEEIAKAAPSKDAEIVTYCSGPACPASAQLAERLRKLGYTRVTEYPEGIAGWTAAGHEVEQTKK